MTLSAIQTVDTRAETMAHEIAKVRLRWEAGGWYLNTGEWKALPDQAQRDVIAFCLALYRLNPKTRKKARRP